MFYTQAQAYVPQAEASLFLVIIFVVRNTHTGSIFCKGSFIKLHYANTSSWIQRQLSIRDCFSCSSGYLQPLRIKALLSSALTISHIRKPCLSLWAEPILRSLLGFENHLLSVNPQGGWWFHEPTSYTARKCFMFLYGQMIKGAAEPSIDPNLCLAQRQSSQNGWKTEWEMGVQYFWSIILLFILYQEWQNMLPRSPAISY